MRSQNRNGIFFISEQEVVKLDAAKLTAEVREEGLGVAADARDELDICLLNTGLLTVRNKHLGASLAANKQAVVAVTTARRNAPGAADVEMRDLPGLEESQCGLVGNTLGQTATTALGGQANRARLSVCFEKLGRQVSTHNFTVTLELEDALEVDVTKLFMNSLNVFRQCSTLDQRTNGSGCGIRSLERICRSKLRVLSINRRIRIDVSEATLAARRRRLGGGRSRLSS